LQTSKIKEINYLGKENTFDITVLKNHNYILSNKIISHNSGKSWSALRMGELLDPNFNIDNVAFSPGELIKLIRDLPKKSVAVMDEAGVSYGSRDFMSRSNKALGGIFQAFRFRQIALIWTLPDVSMIDVNARRLAHTYLETLPVDYVHNHSRVKWYEIKTNRWEGKHPYRIFPRVIVPGRGVCTVKVISFKKPSDELIGAYEEKKKEAFNDLLNYCENVLDGEIKKTEKITKIRRQKKKVDGTYTKEEYERLMGIIEDQQRL